MTNDKFIVIIVDDDESVRRAARRLIKSYRFPVETFASADDFLASGDCLKRHAWFWMCRCRV
jgi:FixJ family two-component response regulator